MVRLSVRLVVRKVHGTLFLLWDRSVDGVQAQSVHVVAYGLQNQHVDHITDSNVDGIAGGLSVGIVDAVVGAAVSAQRRTGPGPFQKPVATSIDFCERPAAMRISQDPGGAGEVTGGWRQRARAIQQQRSRLASWRLAESERKSGRGRLDGLPGVPSPQPRPRVTARHTATDIDTSWSYG
jgi:hypothetical protein